MAPSEHQFICRFRSPASLLGLAAGTGVSKHSHESLAIAVDLRSLMAHPVVALIYSLTHVYSPVARFYGGRVTRFV